MEGFFNPFREHAVTLTLLEYVRVDLGGLTRMEGTFPSVSPGLGLSWVGWRLLMVVPLWGPVSLRLPRHTGGFARGVFVVVADVPQDLGYDNRVRFYSSADEHGVSHEDALFVIRTAHDH